MYKLCYFVPEGYLEQTKQALFAAGAGKIGDYEQCAWQCEGQGQFRPLAGSDPFLGAQGQLERVKEFKVELVCRSEEHTSELQSRPHLVCRLLLEKKKTLICK